MTLADCYNTYKGQSVDIDGHPANAGQCVQWADLVLNQVYGFPYFYAPGAINWWTTPSGPLNNFDKIPYSPSMPIKAGDFVVYGTGVGSQFGHIDVAAQEGVGSSYVGYDSNWGHDLTVHTVNHNDGYNQYILGVLRLKGANTMKPYTYDEPTFYIAWREAFDREPTAAEASNPAFRDPATLANTAWNTGGKDRYYSTHNPDGSPKPVTDTQAKLDQIKAIVG